MICWESLEMACNTESAGYMVEGYGIEESEELDSSVVVTNSSLGNLGGENWSENSPGQSSVAVMNVEI